MAEHLVVVERLVAMERPEAVERLVAVHQALTAADRVVAERVRAAEKAAGKAAEKAVRVVRARAGSPTVDSSKPGAQGFGQS